MYSVKMENVLMILIEENVLCNLGWTGDFCQININECEQGNNCSKNSFCEII